MDKETKQEFALQIDILYSLPFSFFLSNQLNRRGLLTRSSSWKEFLGDRKKKISRQQH